MIETHTTETASRRPRIWRRAAGVLLVGALAACGADGADTAEGSDPSALSDEWTAFEDFLDERADEFSGAVLVANDGDPIVQEAYGLADRETVQPNDIDTRFNLGSVSKMFTGVAIAQLVEQGKLAFGDTIGEYLTGFPDDVADTVTIDQLLTHTSGMGDFLRGGNPEQAKAAETATDLLPLITNEPLLFEPGTQGSYSNSGYAVLGAIIEAVSGESYYDYVRDRIFEPAEMTRTDWFPPGENTDNTAKGYMRSAVGAAGDVQPPSDDDAGQAPPPGGSGGPLVTLPPPGSDGAGEAPPPGGSGGPLVTLPPPESDGANQDPAAGDTDDTDDAFVDNSDVVLWGNPSGGAYSTVGDLLRFSEALLDHELLSPELTATVITGKVPMSSGSAKVAYGFLDGTTSGVRIVGHGGGAPGVGAALDIYPDLGYVVVILANQDDVIDPVHDKTREILAAAS
jgi:CubicO group peptidase (beta-lactamase class C family)